MSDQQYDHDGFSSPQEEVYPPPQECPRCHNSALGAEVFGSGKEWEISCWVCGNLWWTRRRIRPQHFQKYRYHQQGDDPAA